MSEDTVVVIFAVCVALSVAILKFVCGLSGLSVLLGIPIGFVVSLVIVLISKRVKR